MQEKEEKKEEQKFRKLTINTVLPEPAQQPQPQEPAQQQPQEPAQQSQPQEPEKITVVLDPLKQLIETASPTETCLLKYLPWFKNYKKEGDRVLSIPPGVQKRAILQSLWQNMPFYFVLMACMYWLSQGKSYLLTLLTVVLVSLYSFGMHYLSHHLLVMQWYNRYDNMITRSPLVGGFFKLLFQFTDSHATIHHDSSVNKRWYNILLEFINNAVSQGGMLIALKYLLQKADSNAILFWALFYATVHNINYRLVNPEVHKQHHVDPTSNQFMDLWDIIVGTKYDWTTIESHNHTIINAILITALIVVGSRFIKL